MPVSSRNERARPVGSRVGRLEHDPGGRVFGPSGERVVENNSQNSMVSVGIDFFSGETGECSFAGKFGPRAVAVQGGNGSAGVKAIGSGM